MVLKTDVKAINERTLQNVRRPSQIKKIKAHYLNFGEEDQMEIFGYTTNKLKTYVTWTLYFLTVGSLRLFFHWYPIWKLYATHSTCELDKAEKVLIVDKYKGKHKSHFVKVIETLKCGSNMKKSDSVISINGLIFAKNAEDDPSMTFHLNDGTTKELTEARILRCKKLLYVWDNDRKKFIKMAGLDRRITNRELHSFHGFSKKEQDLKRLTYGRNEINVPVQSIFTLLILEALTPFYVFQLFSLIVWVAEYYYYYTIAIAIMSVFGISTSIIQTRKNQQNLKGTIRISDKVLISRNNGIFEEIPTTDLVPGDLIVIPSHGCEMQCDAVLLNGSCIVNESMLTGESVPVTKTALPKNDQLYDLRENSGQTLFCGTRVLQTRYYSNEFVVAVVIRTGFLTAKGQLVRSILYPPPADFKFEKDSYKFIAILALIAALACLYTILSKYSRAIAPLDILAKALDVITIAIPPALPAAMTVGKLFALNRLKKSNIFCINSRVINVSGSVDCICFDKTGTLTEDGLDMYGVVPIENNEIQKTVRNGELSKIQSALFEGMLTCHSLTILDQELCGDPLDVKMFEATGWVLEEPSHSDITKYDLLVPVLVKPNLFTRDSDENSFNEKNYDEIGIVHQYQFSSMLQRMSVITKKLNHSIDHYQLYCKGAPETIINLSQKHTVPCNIDQHLKTYTEKGYRVIAMATKKLTKIPFHTLVKLPRDELECDLEFLGLIIFENRLKPQTENVIRTLKEAGMKVVMVTGDNVLTAVSVARECGIIEYGHSVIDVVTTKPNKLQLATIKYYESMAGTLKTKKVATSLADLEGATKGRLYHLVVSGTAWSDITKYFPHLIPRILTRGVVFARMSGHQKQQLIEELQNLGYYVAMCGDGANDCGALKASNVGISLSEAESSVASPFTSKEPNINCTLKVISEGRAALVTSFGVFKLMLCYSLTELTSVLILYAIDSNLTSLQFLFIDIMLILNFSSFFGKTKAFERLAKEPPMTSLLEATPLASIILFMLVTVAFQALSYWFIQQFYWFEPFIFNAANSIYFSCYENYAIYTISMFQYIIMTVIFSKGKPYRRAIYTNYLLLTSLVGMTVLCGYITLDGAQWLLNALELKLPPFYDARVAILIMALINFMVCLLTEEVIVELFIKRVIDRKWGNLEKFRRKYLKIEEDLRLDSTWPPKIVGTIIPNNNSVKIETEDFKFKLKANNNAINNNNSRVEVTKL